MSRPSFDRFATGNLPRCGTPSDGRRAPQSGVVRRRFDRLSLERTTLGSQGTTSSPEA